MKKIALTVLIAGLILGYAPFVLATDVSLTAGTLLSVNSLTLRIVGEIDELVVNTTTFTVTLTGSEATVYSDDKYTLSVSPTAYTNFDCGASQSLLSMRSLSGSTVTFTITPTATVCDSGDSAGSGSAPTTTTTPASPGGGGGGGVTTPAVPTTTTTPLSSLDSLSSGGGEVSLASPVTQGVFATAESSASLSDNSLSVTLPGGAVSNSGSMTVTAQNNYAQPSAGYAAVNSQVYDISLQTTEGASITQLNNSATLTFRYTNEQITGFDESTLVVSYWNEDLRAWIDLPTIIDTANNIVTATVNHFTKFIVQAKPTMTPAGSLVKTSANPAVYYIGHDGKRYTFNDDKVFNSWYTGFGNVLTITSEQMFAFELGGNVTVRPGTNLIQFVGYDENGAMVVGDPKVYAVEPGGVRRWIETAEIAAALFGSNWEQKIYAVPTSLAGFYVSGESIAEPVYPSGSIVKETATDYVYYISSGQKRLINNSGLSTNGFKEQFYNTAASLSAYEASTAINDYQNSISWTGGK